MPGCYSYDRMQRIVQAICLLSCHCVAAYTRQDLADDAMCRYVACWASQMQVQTVPMMWCMSFLFASMTGDGAAWLNEIQLLPAFAKLHWHSDNAADQVQQHTTLPPSHVFWLPGGSLTDCVCLVCVQDLRLPRHLYLDMDGSAASAASGHSVRQLAEKMLADETLRQVAVEMEQRPGRGSIKVYRWGAGARPWASACLDVVCTHGRLRNGL